MSRVADSIRRGLGEAVAYAKGDAFVGVQTQERCPS